MLWYRKRTSKGKPSISWGKHGPVAFNHLKAICDHINYNPVELPDELTELITAASADVDAIDELMVK